MGREGVVLRAAYKPVKKKHSSTIARNLLFSARVAKANLEVYPVVIVVGIPKPLKCSQLVGGTNAVQIFDDWVESGESLGHIEAIVVRAGAWIDSIKAIYTGRKTFKRGG